MLQFITNNWQPTMGGLIALIATIALVIGKIDQLTWSVIVGIAATWMGITSKQHNVTGIGDKATTDVTKDATVPPAPKG